MHHSCCKRAVVVVDVVAADVVGDVAVVVVAAVLTTKVDDYRWRHLPFWNCSISMLAVDENRNYPTPYCQLLLYLDAVGDCNVNIYKMAYMVPDFHQMVFVFQHNHPKAIVDCCDVKDSQRISLVLNVRLC